MPAKRNYAREQKKFKSSPAAVKKASERKAFRRDAEKKWLVKKWDNKHVHHTGSWYKVVSATKNLWMKEKSRIKWSRRNKRTRGK